jgi:dTDP-4-dehydrorhamnose reductase
MSYEKKVHMTGSSGAFGTKLCKLFPKKYYSVIALDQKPPKIDSSSLIFKECNLSDPSEIEDICKNIRKLDVLINNAAKTDLTFRNFNDLTLEE